MHNTFDTAVAAELSRIELGGTVGIARRDGQGFALVAPHPTHEGCYEVSCSCGWESLTFAAKTYAVQAAESCLLRGRHAASSAASSNSKAA